MRVTSALLESANANDFKKWLAATLKKQGISLTGSSRGGIHIRFALAGGLQDFRKFFQPLGIEVLETEKSISGTFETYNLRMARGNEYVDTGTQLLWVNNVTGAAAGSDRKFGAKMLTPDDLGFAGVTSTAQQTYEKLQKALKSQYPDSADMLLELAKISAQKGTTMGLGNLDLSGYTTGDLATISKNYGEILAAIWSEHNMGFKSVFFPSVSNAALIDFYGKRMDVEYPISVKSGGGGKVTIQNIIDALKDKIAAGKVNPAEQKSYIVFKTVNENNAREGIIQLHRYFDTEPMKELSKVTKIPVDQMSVTTINDWLAAFEDVGDIREALQPFLQSMNTKITDEIWARDDRLRWIVSPMGEWVWKYLNQNEEIQQSLQDLARKLSIIQVNVDLKTKSLNFAKSSFKSAEFIFGWAGYAAGNKLGFKMKMKK